MPAPQFAFTLDELQFWIIKRKDGTVIRHSFRPVEARKEKTLGPAVWTSPGSTYWPHLHDLCNHNLTELPVFEKGGVELYACDSIGARKAREAVDFIIDGGDVISLPYKWDNLFQGDSELISNLSQFGLAPTQEESHKSRLLKIRWADRQAPKVDPAFWPALLSQLKGKVVCCCQGGHGRTGTSLVSLMMCMTDYSPLDAITHLRAVHCPRAIESKEQHEYLNTVAKFLGRPENAHKAEQVKSFKERFLGEDFLSAHPWVASYQTRLRSLKED